MVVLLGPCFSLSASGTVGKALLYYDTKYGARVRIPKRSFTPPSQSWIINQAWFKKADVRSRTLTPYQKAAWQLAYPGECDSWRDIFMGHQITAWNLSPMNNLTWPQITPGSPGVITARPLGVYGNVVDVSIDTDDVAKRKRWSIAHVWFIVFDNARQPVEADMVKSRRYSGWWSVEFVPGHVNHVWGGVWMIDGSFVVDKVGAYDR